MTDTIIALIKGYYVLFLIASALLAAVANGYRHMILPLVFIVLMFGYRYYHHEQAHFMTAVRHGELQKVRRYLSWYSNPNYTTETGLTPLLIASIEGHTEIVKLLLNRGANVQATFREHTPAQLAAQGGHQEIVELLQRQHSIIS